MKRQLIILSAVFLLGNGSNTFADSQEDWTFWLSGPQDTAAEGIRDLGVQKSSPISIISDDGEKYTGESFPNLDDGC